MKKHYLITGGSGFIGSALVLRLLKQGHRVRVLDNEIRGRSRRLISAKDDIEFIIGDIRERGVVFKACEGVDAVCHLAFINGTELFYLHPELVLDVAVKGMINILDASIHHGIQEFVLTSSSEVYQTPAVIPTDESIGYLVPDPLNPRYSYSGGKIINELMLIHYTPRHFKKSVIIRPHNVYGPDMGWEHVIPQFILRMKDLVKAGGEVIKFPIQGTGQEKRAFIFIDDFIDGTILAMKHGGQKDIFHIGTSDEISIQRLAEQIGAFFSKKVSIVPGKDARGGTVRRCPNINKLKQLGFQPEIALTSGLALTIEWYLQYAHLWKEDKFTI